MCADNDIYLSCRKILKYKFHLFGCSRSGKIVNPYRQILQSLCKRAVMLIGKHCRRHKHCCLLSVSRSLECRSDCNLGLSESYVAANQTIHRTLTFHIPFHIGGSGDLIRSIFINKRCLQLLLHISVRRKSEAPFVTACCIKLYKISRYILEFCFCLLFDLVPCT